MTIINPGDSILPDDSTGKDQNRYRIEEGTRVSKITTIPKSISQLFDKLIIKWQCISIEDRDAIGNGKQQVRPGLEFLTGTGRVF